MSRTVFATALEPPTGPDDDPHDLVGISLHDILSPSRATSAINKRFN